MIPFSTSAMDQILAREPKMAISGPFPGIFRRKIRSPLDPAQAALSHRESRRGGGGSKPPEVHFLAASPGFWVGLT